jgi:hypothetical protein
MTTTYRETQRPAPTDLRTATRVFAAILLPVGPACVALLRFFMPYMTTDSSDEIGRHIAAEQGRESLVVWLGLVAVLTLAPAALFVARTTRVAAPKLTVAALLLLVPGYLAIGFLVSSDSTAWYAAHKGYPTDTIGDLYANGHPALYAAGGIFVLGHVLGTVLLGIALLRSGVVPAPFAWLVVVAQPLHFVAAVIVGSHTLDMIAWGSNAVGFAAVSVAILRMNDDEWDPR